MDRAKFYAALRKRGSGVFGTSLSRGQVEGIEADLNEAEKRRTPLKWLSYMLATDYHETAHTMQPIAEYGKGRGKKYGVKGKYGQAPYGRGKVQLTWDYNYEKADLELRLRGALLQNFDLAMRMDIAVQIMFQGMEKGWFTGKKLSDYTDYLPMRRIINGTDKANLIAGYAVAFERALREAGYGQWPVSKPVAPADPVKEMDAIVASKPGPAPVPKQNWLAALMAAIAAMFKRKG